MIRIEQQPEDVALSFELQVNAEISGVRLSSANISRSSPDFVLDEYSGFLTSGVSFKPAERKRLDQRITLAVEFEYRIRSGDMAGTNDGQDLARIRCKFEADYDLSPNFDPSELQVVAFHGGNAIFNCWPYFREFIQTATTRMGFPPATVPFLRLIPKAPPAIEPSPNAVTAPGPKGAEAKRLGKRPE